MIFHGLEGSAKSHYANDMLATLVASGWQSVIMHFRSCGKEINRAAQSYHSGATEDAKVFLEHLKTSMPTIPKVAIGFSLGANMLLKLLGETPRQDWVKGAVAIAAPFRLDDCAESVNKGFSRVYQHYLLRSMKRKALFKMNRGDFADYPWLSNESISGIKSFREFDELITAPVHGFDNAKDYYNKASACHYTHAIQTPTLMLHATDDPFMSTKVIPTAAELSDSIVFEQHKMGGHVGFLQGKPWNSSVWLHKRIPDYLSQFADTPS